VEALVAIAIGVLTGTGVFLMLRARTFPVLLGLTLLFWWVPNRKVRMRNAFAGAAVAAIVAQVPN